MKLAARQVKLDACPHASEEACSTLGAATEPPIRKVVIGTGDGAVTLGEELVLYRHEKTFFHKTAFAPEVTDTMDESELLDRLDTWSGFKVDRAGESLTLDLIAVKETSGNADTYRATVETVSGRCALPIVLVSKKIDCLRAALQATGKNRPLIWGADDKNFTETASLAKEFNVPLVAEASGVEGVASLARSLKEAGVEDIVLAPRTNGLSDSLRDFTLLRRGALNRSLKGAGYPLAADIDASDYAGIAAAAGTVCKYGALAVLRNPSKWGLLSLLTLRQNIYTDPQKPLQVEPKIYTIGDAAKDSPLFVTTNFSLTYFMVSSEIEASEIPSRLLIVEAEGQSVLTAWAAGKFNADSIAKAVESQGLHTLPEQYRRIIIPGYVAMISGDLEDKLPGWNVMVGPQESADIPAYAKEVLTTVKS
jgi:acetyl-CoA decarbonylase/synthase complex subunit gamma